MLFKKIMKKESVNRILGKLAILIITALMAFNAEAMEGDTIWIRPFDIGGNEYAFGAAVDKNKNVIVTGGNDGGACITVKYDSNGNTQWAQLFQGRGTGIAVDPNNNNIIVVVYNTESGSEDWLVVKYNPDGDSEWVRIFDYAGGSDQATSVRVDSLGNIYVAGYIDNISNVDYFLVWCL